MSVVFVTLTSNPGSLQPIVGLMVKMGFAGFSTHNVYVVIAGPHEPS